MGKTGAVSKKVAEHPIPKFAFRVDECQVEDGIVYAYTELSAGWFSGISE